MRPRAVVAWSSGKDAAYALHEVRDKKLADVVGILTTITDAYSRVSMHGVREQILDLQAEALGLPCTKVRIPTPCTDEVYAAKMTEALAPLKRDGVTHVVFGDLFLEDVRSYREQNLDRAGMHALFPLWHLDTRELAREMIRAGLRARITCVDPRRVDASLAGRAWDMDLVTSLSCDVDPCGENGEFHTLVTHGPMFASPIHVTPGETVERDGFVFADMCPVDTA
ncbi:MAG: adenine nucleotide alpha hydrolase [Deltaproteobacteria bacterium]|nr:adenine nucleotide alpha hydrolase [Deltaproteobacteria bacterium]